MSKSRPAQKHAPARHPNRDAPEVVDPRWIINALIVTLAAALVCGWLTYCLLFYQGQWQFVLHPSTAVPTTPSSLGLQFEPYHFAVDETGRPQLTGWNIPGTQPGMTILFLHDGDTTMSAALPRIRQLHDLGFSVFVFDYRGYGASAVVHPNQVRMNEDAEHAFAHLTSNLKFSAKQVIPYGAGVGASLAASLAVKHTEIPAIMLESPHGDLLPVVAEDPRTHVLPLRLLFHDRFPLAAPLQALNVPKLLISTGSAAPEAFRNAADPKRMVELPASAAPSAYEDAVRRFAEEYLASSTVSPVPSAAPAGK